MNCPICDEKLTLENTVNTECNHKFCKTCFWKWTKENNTCALCRHSILANSEELRDFQHIRILSQQRGELSRQVEYFRNELNKLKRKVNEEQYKQENNQTTFISTPELNRIRLDSIFLNTM